MRHCRLCEILPDLDKCNWLILSTRRGKVQIAGFHDRQHICAYRMKANWREPLLRWMGGDTGAVAFEYLRWHDDLHRHPRLGILYPGAVYVRPGCATILHESAETAQQTGNLT